MVTKALALGAAGAFAAFVLAGPLQHLGVLPETALGSASKAAIRTALGLGVSEAWGRCGGWGHGRGKGNNGFGNGGSDGVPGGSSHQDLTR